MEKMMRTLTKLITILVTNLIWLFFNIAHGAVNQQLAQVETLLEHKLTVEKQGVGVAVILIDGNTRHDIHLGFANKHNEQLVNGSTEFEIGSITKTFTATALASMVIEGKVTLSDTVQHYLPDNIELDNKAVKEITLLSLANHSSGLPRLPTNMPMSDPQNPYVDYTVEHLARFLTDYQPSRQVGEQHEYSNLGVGLLGHVLQEIDKTDYQTMLMKRVLAPLNMLNTSVVPSSNKSKLLSQGYDIQLQPTKHWQFATMGGAGALYSTSDDMAQYLQANLAGSPLTEAISLAQTATANFGNKATEIGLGWIIQTMQGHTLTIHNGGTGGYRSFIGMNRKTNKGIVVLANSVFDYEDIAYAYLTDSLDQIEMKTPVNLSVAQLNNLIGKFQLLPNFVLTITQENQQLFVQATGQQKLPLTALSATEFEISAIKAKIIFETNEQGKATKATLYQGGQVMLGAKI